MPEFEIKKVTAHSTKELEQKVNRVTRDRKVHSIHHGSDTEATVYLEKKSGRQRLVEG